MGRPDGHVAGVPARSPVRARAPGDRALPRRQAPPLPERLRYVDSDRGVGAEAVRLITEVHGSDPFYALPQILERVGVDVWAIIDAHRKAPAPRTFGDVVGGAAPTDSTDLSAGQRGGPGWVDGIGTGIAAGFHRAVSQSVTRLGERYVAAFDSNGKDAAESHGLRKDLAVAYHHLSPVVAIDRLVGRVMVDDLVRVDPAPAAKPAPVKDKPADAPTAAQPTVTSAAQRVAENAGQVDMALGLNRRGPGGLHMPPKEIHALRHSLDDLADTLHDHARQDRDEVKELDVARAKVEAVQRQLVGRYGGRNAEVTSLAKAVGRVWAAPRANQPTDAPDTQDERDGLASVARESLAMLEGARSMIEQAQGQVPRVYVFSKHAGDHDDAAVGHGTRRRPGRRGGDAPGDRDPDPGAVRRHRRRRADRRLRRAAHSDLGRDCQRLRGGARAVERVT